ncbi:hypothetical protein [Mycobacterium sp. EPa45]|nr:hypothetical protein [Mycobacterium sp. EPa45]
MRVPSGLLAVGGLLGGLLISRQRHADPSATRFQRVLDVRERPTLPEC